MSALSLFDKKGSLQIFKSFRKKAVMKEENSSVKSAGTRGSPALSGNANGEEVIRETIDSSSSTVRRDFSTRAISKSASQSLLAINESDSDEGENFAQQSRKEMSFMSSLSRESSVVAGKFSASKNMSWRIDPNLDQENEMDNDNNEMQTNDQSAVSTTTNQNNSTKKSWFSFLRR